MKENEKESKQTPPYVAYKTLKNFWRSLAQGIPPRIDKSMMRSMSGGTQVQLIQALKALNLIDAHGVPQPKMEKLVKAEGEEFKKTLREVLTAGYPFLRTASLNIKTATMKMLEEEFEKLASGGTVSKCITFFIPAAKDAGLELSPYIEKPGKRSSNGKLRKARASGVKGEQHHEERPPPPPAGQLSWNELLLGKFPAFDQSWSDDVKSKWLDNFAALRVAGEKKS